MPRSLPADHYSEALAGVARFTLKYKAVVIGAWLGLATVLALVFPQPETVVRQQSVDPVPRDVASFQSLDRMGKAFGEVGSATTVVVAMENSSGLTSQVRERYSVMLDKLRADSGQVELVRDLLADPTTARQATSDDGKAWYLPAGIAGTFGAFTSSPTRVAWVRTGPPGMTTTINALPKRRHIPTSYAAAAPTPAPSSPPCRPFLAGPSAPRFTATPCYVANAYRGCGAITLVSLMCQWGAVGRPTRFGTGGAERIGSRPRPDRTEPTPGPVEATPTLAGAAAYAGWLPECDKPKSATVQAAAIQTLLDRDAVDFDLPRLASRGPAAHNSAPITGRTPRRARPA